MHYLDGWIVSYTSQVLKIVYIDVSFQKALDLLDLKLVAGAQATDYLSSFSFVLCCRFHLPPAVLISLSTSLFYVFFGRPLFLWPCGIHCSACLAMLPSFLRKSRKRKLTTVKSILMTCYLPSTANCVRAVKA